MKLFREQVEENVAQNSVLISFINLEAMHDGIRLWSQHSRGWSRRITKRKQNKTLNLEEVK